jgi:fused signal recognition particle receptor
VIFFVGVNGVGKTTSLGKIAHMFQRQGKKTMLVAADTFRAAAVEQLNVWSQRTGAELIKNPQGRDPGAVLFDALRAAKTRGTEVVLVDTAGRLHTKVNLMEELKKLVRIAGREVPGAPHEVFLVVDASTGQNALQQAKIFQQNIRPTGIILTKLDGTAKGGVIIGIYEELGIPVRFVGMGEREDDLEEFDADQFVEAMFEAGTG